MLSDFLEQAIENVIAIRLDLKAAGFMVNEQKSIWLPTQRLKWLGFLLNAKDNVFEVPGDKLCRILASIAAAHK